MPERFCSSGEQQQLCAACHVQLEERLLAVLTVTDLHRGLASIGMDLLQGVPLHRRSRKLNVRRDIRVHHTGIGDDRVALDLAALGADDLVHAGLVIEGHRHDLRTVLQAALIDFEVGEVREGVLYLGQALYRIFPALLAAVRAEGEGLSLQREVGGHTVLTVLHEGLPLVLVLLALLPGRFLCNAGYGPAHQDADRKPQHGERFQDSFSHSSSFLPAGLAELRGEMRSVFSLSRCFLCLHYTIWWKALSIVLF